MKSRRSWSDKQDDAFGRLARESEPKNWSLIAKRLASEFGFKRRSGKQCRQRWYNHLVPGISKKVWSKAEEERLMQLHKRFGNKWTLIAEHMPGRTDNSIKNYFYSTVRRSLRRMGKLIGSKNSTSLMRAIKPSTLTQIFSVLTEDTLPFHEDLQSEFETFEVLRQSCEDVRDEIVQFSSFKPKKSDEVEESERSRYERVFQVILKLNSVYERYRGVQRTMKSEEEIFKEGFKQMMKEDSSEEEPLSEIEENSREEAEGEVYPELIKNRTTRTRKIKIPEKLSCLANIQSINTEPQIVVRQAKQQQVREQKAEELDYVAHSPEYSPSLVELDEPFFQIDLKEDMNFTLNVPLTSPNFYFGTPADRVNFFKSPLAMQSRLHNNNFSFFSNNEEREQ